MPLINYIKSYSTAFNGRKHALVGRNLRLTDEVYHLDYNQEMLARSLRFIVASVYSFIFVNCRIEMSLT